MVQPSQQHVAPCVKLVKWGFGTRGAKIFFCKNCIGLRFVSVNAVYEIELNVYEFKNVDSF